MFTDEELQAQFKICENLQDSGQWLILAELYMQRGYLLNAQKCRDMAYGLCCVCNKGFTPEEWDERHTFTNNLDDCHSHCCPCQTDKEFQLQET